MKTKILGSLAVALLAGPIAANAVGVVVGGKEWRQLTETLNFSWNQVAQRCDPNTGACSGSIGSVSFDGWTWAANTDIQPLFEQLIMPASIQFPTSTTNYGSVNNLDIAAAIGPGNFTPTFSVVEFDGFAGLSRTKFNDALAFGPGMNDRPSVTGLDLAQLGQATSISSPRADFGVWLYRSVVPGVVPEPGTLALLGLGLTGLALSRKRKAH